MSQTIEVSKDDLLVILNENRAKHRRVFDAAVDGYRKRAIARLEATIQDMQAGRLPDLHFRLVQPEDHTRDYDRVIRMVEMHQLGTLEMDESTFAAYVQDDWQWKRQFLTASNVYAAGATQAEYGDFDG